MNWFVCWLYLFLVKLIRAVKWIECRILVLFTPLIVRIGEKIAASVGIELLFNGEQKGRVKICNSKYERTLRIKCHTNKGFARIACYGTLAFGESFMNNWWEAESGNPEDVTEAATRVMENNLLNLWYHPWNKFLEWVELYAFNLQTPTRAFEVGQKHYDLGNDLYEAMLDPWMQYTCGYWKDVKANNLGDAQIAKMDLIAKKLELKPGMKLLDIGSGWGYLCKYLASKYQVECVGVTISKEQVSFAKELCKGLPVEIRLQDYREVNEQFDRIVSVGMFEHVGHWNYREYFQVASKCLKDDGIFLLQTIGRNHFTFPGRSENFSHQYIFPNGQVPSPEDISKSTRELFVIEDWHNFGQDYAKTLFCWRENFMASWDKLQPVYGDRFYRMWIFYLSMARAFFRSRRLQLWQIVLSKDGLKREYRSIR